MKDLNIQFRIGIDRRQLAGVLALGALFAGAGRLDSETLTMSTTYPAPSGVYQSMVVTNQATLARDGGNVAVGGAANPGASLFVAGSVGVGNAAPAVKLDVTGNTRVSGALSVVGAGGVSVTGGGVGIAGGGGLNVAGGGKFTLADGSQGLNKVLTSDAGGTATWQTPSSISNLTTYWNWALGPNTQWIGAHDFCALNMVENVWAAQAVICWVYPSGGAWYLYEDSDPSVGLPEGCGAICIN